MTQLTTQQTINLPVLSNPELVAEVFEVNLEGMAASFPRIKFPSGGMLAFEVPGDDGADVAKELVGVIIDQVSNNSYWSKKFDGSTQPPDCFSADGKIGHRSPEAVLPWWAETMECATCQFNQYGSGEDKRGKACKNNRKLYMVREGEILPVEILVPPSSLKALQTYMVQLTTKVKPIDGVVTKIKLKKAESAGGIEYSEAVFTKVADLNVAERDAIRSYAKTLRSVIRSQQGTQEPTNAPTHAPSAPVAINDEDIPF